MIIDASALVEALLETPHGERVTRAMRGATWIAPDLAHAETVSAIARLVRASRVKASVASKAIQQLARIPLITVPLRPLAPKAWELRNRVWIYDAFYVACASLLDETLLTTDGRLARAALPGVSVLLVS